MSLSDQQRALVALVGKPESFIRSPTGQLNYLNNGTPQALIHFSTSNQFKTTNSIAGYMKLLVL